MPQTSTRHVRKSVLAGTWYPGSPTELSKMVDRFLANVSSSPIKGTLLGVIAPHAGYVYSGQVAAYAYKQLEGLQFETVAVISPVHRMYMGEFVVNDSAYYETPLGLVELDRSAIEELATYLPLTRVSWDEEHSLEIQLPFLQRVLPRFKLLPVMQGNQSLSACQTLAGALVQILMNRKALLVASSDLSHFHSYQTAVRLDSQVKELIEAYDPLGLSHSLDRGQVEACGGGPIVTVMLAAQSLGADRAIVLHYANSGDVTGERTRVVGYLSAAIYRAE